jgi:hypothetical protein
MGLAANDGPIGLGFASASLSADAPELDRDDFVEFSARTGRAAGSVEASGGGVMAPALPRVALCAAASR